jgi:hypothetical protein
VCRELRPGYTLERVAIDNGVDGDLSALLFLPDRRQKPAPAVLWLHSSSPDKNQLLIPNTNGGAEPLGEVFVGAGYVVLAPDAYWHGDRAGTGPSGPVETGVREQEALFKLHLWMGRTLWGMFVRDDRVALDYLCARPEVDARRIGATGMSMGSTRAWWLAAVDERVAAAVGVACLTRYQNLIAHGQLRQHGVYYWVYGLLKHCDTEGVVALIAPRPFLALTGELDARLPRGWDQGHRGEGGGCLCGAGRPRAFQERPLPRRRPHVHAGDAGRDAGLVRALADARRGGMKPSGRPGLFGPGLVHAPPVNPRAAARRGCCGTGGQKPGVCMIVRRGGPKIPLLNASASYTVR